MKKILFSICITIISLLVASCFSANGGANATGGEVTGVSGASMSEPAPYGMVLVKRGSLKMGSEKTDSLWGKDIPTRDISVDAFWMDEREVTNAMYRQFVYWVRDSILRERLADAGNEAYRIELDKEGEPLEHPYLNWNKALPKNPDEEQQEIIESMYTYHPVTGEKMLDVSQLNYRYETFDHVMAAKRKFRLNANERTLNTDIEVDPNEVVMISKDTAYVDDEGVIHRETITRPLSSMWDFVNTYIVNVYPDTTCWVNDFQNADTEVYMRLYFTHQNYNEYPVVGVSWEQANAFCNWRTDFLIKGLGSAAKYMQRYRLPTEAEWEFAARGKDGNELPWEHEGVASDKGCYYANFKPDRGNYTKDGNLITSKVGIYSANSNGLYDMAGNVAEWTSTVYTEAGVLSMSDMNPTLVYNAAKEDPYALKKKSVRGGSWKDPESFIKSAWRSSEYQNVGRSFIGFRCVRSQVGTPGKARR
ncbi:MAG: SUMF1/EgtB/PvdO family nonheme iron enzyme [Bacteroidaceae bacterium]|nr:SUMF1/EgtB/PvdO family nonheme iron enzyme [Bacteroidaceae bacterium]